MPLAVTHFVISVIIFTLIRDYFIKNNKRFPVYYVFIGGLAGLLPDIDFAFYLVLSFFGFTYDQLHRTFTHNIFFSLIFVGLAGITKSLKSFKIGNKIFHYSTLFLVIAGGILIHLILDATVGGYIFPLYPFSDFVFGLNLPNYLPDNIRGVFFPILDAVFLIFWISYLEFKHKISSFF